MAEKKNKFETDDYELDLESKDTLPKKKSKEPTKVKEEIINESDLPTIEEHVLEDNKPEIDDYELELESKGTESKEKVKKPKKVKKEVPIEEPSEVEESESIDELPSKEKSKKKKIDLDISKILILGTSIFGFLFYIYNIMNVINSVNYFQNIVNYTFILIVFELLIAITFVKKKLKEIFSILICSLIIIFLIFNIVIKANVFKAPVLAVLKDYTSGSLINVINDCKKNNIDLIKVYEYSDNVKEGNIISQSVLPDTILKDVEVLTVVISSGPNYDKELMLTDFVGLTTDELMKFIDENKLNNVTINFDVNNDIAKDLVVSQSTIGKIKRNTSVTFNISLGRADALTEIKLDDLTKKSVFDATLYLKRNGIKYELVYEFSKTVDKNYIIKQNKKKSELVKPLSDTVILTVSLGEEIKIPDFTGKTSDDVLEFIVKNNLLVEFVEKYDVKVTKGGLIGINYKTGEAITSGTKIIIYTSLGPVVVPKFNSLGEFRTWAQLNNINYSETYTYNDTVAKGDIIKLSVASGDAIDPINTNIAVTISQGKAVVVPYFVNKSKTEIQTLCRNNGLNCTFYYTGFSATALDHATRQNVSSGARVVSGTYVNIGLSNGQPKTYSVYIQGEWYQTTADNSIAVIKRELAKVAPGVNFNFVKKASNTGFSGQIHESSPTKGGSNNFTQGNTYTIWIIA